MIGQFLYTVAKTKETSITNEMKELIETSEFDSMSKTNSWI